MKVSDKYLRDLLRKEKLMAELTRLGVRGWRP